VGGCQNLTPGVSEREIASQLGYCNTFLPH
jgi:hypothetical protein